MHFLMYTLISLVLRIMLLGIMVSIERVLQNWGQLEAYVGGEPADKRQPQEEVAEEQVHDQTDHQGQPQGDVAVQEAVDLLLEVVYQVLEQVPDVDEQHRV